ncbi:DMT family transporter [Anaerotignum lactatifermentans]|uniref:DMT family transporter n=1 Tax=Anaerotignum lactatifermentans TaxID=160404 RepID=A0ABS2G948_9FIRM|nr:DMT family transporter [Anaerotignum lactatifermentans]MBM6828552.1 DMT family transporter [Anaerotignum lactatifermentans]MBM6877959.1 DMT family transporter [Anaerotignum lactatifermentans]MBM6950134.1 DMT family transporter [Anaerotignum lactatifermentans]
MNQKKKVFLYSFITVFLWASAFPLTKIAQQHFTANALGLVRCSVAACFLLLIGKMNHIKRPRLKDIPVFFLAGLCGFTLYLICFNTGIQTLTSATSSIVIAITPILTAVLASAFYKEKINWIGWISILGAFAGVLVLLLWEGIFSVNIGIVWTLGAACVFCAYNFINKNLAKKGYNALEIVTYSMLCGAILFLFSLLPAVELLKTSAPAEIASLIYLGIFPSAIAYFLWGKAMSYAEKTSEVTNFMFVTPLLSTVLGFIILKEMPNMGTFLGGAIIICCIVVFNLKGKQ